MDNCLTGDTIDISWSVHWKIPSETAAVGIVCDERKIRLTQIGPYTSLVSTILTSARLRSELFASVRSLACVCVRMHSPVSRYARTPKAVPLRSSVHRPCYFYEWLAGNVIPCVQLRRQRAASPTRCRDPRRLALDEKLNESRYLNSVQRFRCRCC